MPFSYRELFFGGTQFCCCLPVRAGVISMSLLGIILSGILTIILWYEVASTPDLTSGERAGFVLAGLLETFLCVVSILGFVGAIVRKQLFVQIYAYFIYVHFFINVGVAAYLLWLITHFSENAATKACQDTIKNTDAQQQCIGILQIARGVYFVIAALVLLIEMYGAIIVARYLNQIQREKRTMRASRMSMGYTMFPVPHSEYVSLTDTRRMSQFSALSPEPYKSAREFNAYEEFDPYRNQSQAGPSAIPEVELYSNTYGLPIEAGYGGGTWTHSEISIEEKARLQRSEAVDATDHQRDEFEEVPSLDEEQQRKRDSDSKSPGGPLPPMRTRDMDDLPRYSY
ncbi:uncharacterized protein BT62DRAFT_938446 [Guyanagaster necrorhizus]|uniref:Uncharacterized protein n=1 Tax=Guyanagaster necrorhizus TaxID=856835 RepID=A0A9P7VH86_9AGAR|nr:uncharacterized protein BT62DRAFT_938446 [Guyanagaster necrorhizus MCA 3950]KAG7440021.1 hypothetical protein BT62DRAFT_938446 [Guyanagaster necrorhizus MCA 3950]